MLSFCIKAKDCYHIQSDNLELATVIECVSAAGDSILPTVILKDGSMPDLQAISEDSYGL